MKPRRHAGRPRHVHITLPGRPPPPEKVKVSAHPREVAHWEITDRLADLGLKEWTTIAAVKTYQDSVTPRIVDNDIAAIRPGRDFMSGVWQETATGKEVDDVARAKAHRAFARQALGEPIEALLHMILVEGLHFKACVDRCGFGGNPDWARQKVAILFRRGCATLSKAYASEAGRLLLARGGFKQQ